MYYVLLGGVLIIQYPLNCFSACSVKLLARKQIGRGKKFCPKLRIKFVFCLIF